MHKGEQAFGRPLTRSDDPFRLLLDCVTDPAIVLLDADGRIAAWGAGARQLFGYQAAEVVGRHFRILFTAQDAEEALPEEELRAAAATGCAGKDRFHVHKDGRRLWCGGKLTALRHNAGPLRGFVQVLQDKSVCRVLDEELRRANERFRLAAAAFEGLIYDVDLLAGTVLRSEGLLPLVGFRPDEAGNSAAWWIDRIHPDDHAGGLRPAQDAFADPTRDHYEVEYRVLHHDGHYIYVWDRALIFRDEAGRPVRLVGSTFDITARKRAEAALLESEERHRVISELTSDWNYALDVAPDGTAELALVTEGFTRITGYTLEEVNAKGGWVTIVHEDDLPAAFAGFGRVIAGESIATVVRLVIKDGSSRWVWNLNKPVWDKAQGRVVRILAAAQDVTERRQAEEELRESRSRLQILSRQLIATQENERRRLAHELHDEIGQMLTAISIHPQRVKAVAGKAAHGHLEEAVSVVAQSIERVRYLSLDLRPSMLDDLGLEPALRWYADRLIRTTGVTIHLDIGLGGQRLPADLETACFRVVQEALTNAARHSKARRVWIELHQRGPSVELAVRDDGVGFDPQEARRRGAGGSSFGLLGMQERVELLGGTFAVESQPGHGASIRANFLQPPGHQGRGSETEKPR